MFFQPYYAGQTFGLGQLNPLTALEMSDLVHQVSGLPRLDAGNPNQVYETIMDPDLTLAYVAAALKKSIDAYRQIAGFDISQNPGITATLYNVGNPEARAHALKRENDERAARGEAAAFPRRELLRLAGQREAAGTPGAVLAGSSFSWNGGRKLSLTRQGNIALSAGSRSHSPPHMNRPR